MLGTRALRFGGISGARHSARPAWPGWRAYIFGEVTPDEEVRNRPIRWFIGTFSLVLMFTLFAAIFIAAANFSFLYNAPEFERFFGICLLTGATGYAAGGFAGFLFGVPKVQTAESAQPAAVSSNTNLEQVSDWLAKIIVGVSLVEFQHVNEGLVAFSDQVDRATSGVRGAGFAAALVLVGSAIAGFLAAYLKSKVGLLAAFAPIEKVQSELGAVFARELMGDAGETVLNNPQYEPEDCAKKMAAKLIQLVPPDNNEPELSELVGLAHATSKNYATAADAFAAAREQAKKQGKPMLRLDILSSRAETLAGNPREAGKIAEETPAAAKTDKERNELRLAEMLAKLYAPGGYDDAIAIGEQLKTDKAMSGSGRLQLYLAAAQGQRYAALQVGSAASEELAAARAAALEATRRALQLDPVGNKRILQGLWDKNAKGKDPQENDLEVFSMTTTSRTC